MKTKRLLIYFWGLVSVLIYALLLYFHPQESWCDDAFWTDWARQLAIYGRYFTTVWGGGHPSYCPLYAYLLAGWIKIFGFSYFKVRLFNVLLLLICYLALSFFLLNKSTLTKTSSLILFSILFWFLPSLFEIYNCGRIEVLCLLLSVFSFIYFVRLQDSLSANSIIGLFFSSVLLFATGVEGVVFAVLLCSVYSISLHILKRQKHVLVPFLILGFGYIASLVGLIYITKKNNCLHEFFKTMFGFSDTLSKYYFAIRQLVKNAIHGQFTSLNIIQDSSEISLLSSIGNHYIMNNEYFFILIILISALILFFVKKKKLSSEMLAFSLVAITAPLVYTLAGRYVSYYQWAAFIPVIIAICALIDKFQIRGSLLCAMVVCSMAYFCCKYDWDNFDIKREKDILHQKEIVYVSDLLTPRIPCVIPYQWYYYVLPLSENIYFQGSGGAPKDLQYIIYSANDYNEKEFMDCFELEEIKRFDDKIVYKVLSIKESWIIRY